MTVNEIEGAAIARVTNAGIVGRLPLRRGANEAYEEVVQAIRDSDTDICNDISFIDLRAQLNTYPVPPNSDSIRKVERRDLTGVTSPDNPVFVPCGHVTIGMIHRARTPAYAIGPTGLVLWPTPPNDYTQGLRVTTLPVAEQLDQDAQEPRIPKHLHKVIVAHLVRHLGSLADVQLTQAAGDYISVQEKYLVSFLNPSGREAIQRFARTKSTYHPRRF